MVFAQNDAEAAQAELAAATANLEAIMRKGTATADELNGAVDRHRAGRREQPTAANRTMAGAVDANAAAQKKAPPQ